MTGRDGKGVRDKQLDRYLTEMFKTVHDLRLLLSLPPARKLIWLSRSEIHCLSYPPSCPSRTEKQEIHLSPSHVSPFLVFACFLSSRVCSVMCDSNSFEKYQEDRRSVNSNEGEAIEEWRVVSLGKETKRTFNNIEGQSLSSQKGNQYLFSSRSSLDDWEFTPSLPLSSMVLLLDILRVLNCVRELILVVRCVCPSIVEFYCVPSRFDDRFLSSFLLRVSQVPHLHCYLFLHFFAREEGKPIWSAAFLLP